MSLEGALGVWKERKVETLDNRFEVFVALEVMSVSLYIYLNEMGHMRD